MITRHKIAFRFIVIFFTLLMLPFPFRVLPFLNFIGAGLLAFYQKVVPWIGSHVLHLPSEITIFGNGSGDTTYNYVLLLFQFGLALFGTLLWTVLERKPKNYERINYWFLVTMRYYLGMILFQYGIVKIIQLQFPPTNFYRLLEPIGDASPMGLAWTFLGFSAGYNLFIGLGEAIGGVLLFHRKTKILGCIVSIAVTVNIVAINFFYDVPVKLFSSQLLVMAVLILSPDLKQIFRVILLNLPTQSIQFYQPFKQKKWRKAALALKVLFIGYILFTLTFSALQSQYIYGKKAILPPLFGLYEVKDFSINQNPIQPLLNHPDRWRYLDINKGNRATVYQMDMTKVMYLVEVDSVKQRIDFKFSKDESPKLTFHYEESDAYLHLTGKMQNDSIAVKLIKRTLADFNLTNRKFRWINEYPDNQ